MVRMFDLVFLNLAFCEVNRNVFRLVDEDNHHPALEINIRLAIKIPPRLKNNTGTTKYNICVSFSPTNVHQQDRSFSCHILIT